MGKLFCGQSPSIQDVNTSGVGTVYVTGPEQWTGSKIHVSKWTTNPKRIVPDGCIFITVKGAGVGKTFPGIPCAIGRDVYAFKPNSDVSQKFIYWAIIFSVQDVIRHAVGDIPGISKSHIADHEIFVPPFEAQEFVVAEIEKQFSRLDEAVASLKRIQTNLKRYKAAVLKAAVEGKLTEQWRKDHPAVEPAEQLLKRILAERRAKWEAEELAKMKAKGIKPKDDTWKKKYKTPELSVSDNGLFGWISALVGSICDIEDGDRGENYPKKTDFMNDGYCLFLSTKNVRPDGFLFDQMQFICKEKHESLRKGLLERGDIVFTSRGTLGNIAHYDDNIPHGCVRINSGMFILRGFSVFMIEEYFDYYLKSPAVRTQIDKLQSGTAQPQLPIREFKTFEVKFPSKVEQKIIVQEIDRRLSVTEELEATIETNLKRAERLRQTILQRAFSGGLV